MRTTMVGLCSAGLFVVGMGAAPALSIPGTLHSRDTKNAVVGTVTKVVLHGDSGDLRVQAGKPVNLSTHQQWNIAAPSLKESFSAGVLTVTTSCPNLPENNCAVDVTVTVPAAVTVQATANVGNLRTHDLVGSETLQADVGDVLIENVTADTVSGAAQVGNVVATLPHAPLSTTLTAGTGDVRATVPSGAYVLTTSAQTGDVTVSGVTNDSRAARRLTARTDTGDVTVQGR